MFTKQFTYQKTYSHASLQHREAFTQAIESQMFMRQDSIQEEFFCGLMACNPFLLLSLLQPGSPSGKHALHNLCQYISDDVQMSDRTELIELVVANKIVELRA